MVSVGFSALPVVNWLPSLMNTLGMSCVWPHVLTTPSCGRALMRLVPRLWVSGTAVCETVQPAQRPIR